MLIGTNAIDCVLRNLMVGSTMVDRLLVRLISCWKSLQLFIHVFQIPRADWFSEIYNETLAQLVTSLSQQIMDRNGALFKETFVANRSLAFFLKNLLSVMDRGKVFDLIKIYWTKFGNLNLADGKGVVKLRVEFLSIVCTHEHFVALSLPVIARNKHFGTVWTKGNLNHNSTIILF